MYSDIQALFSAAPLEREQGSPPSRGEEERATAVVPSKKA